MLDYLCGTPKRNHDGRDILTDETNEGSFQLNRNTVSAVWRRATSKEGRMVREELCDLKPHVSVVRTTATSPDISMTENQSHSHGRWRDRGQEILPSLGDEREGTSVGSDQRNHRHELSIGMASVDHEIRSKHSAASTKSHERNLQKEDFSLRVHSS